MAVEYQGKSIKDTSRGNDGKELSNEFRGEKRDQK